MKKKIAIVFLLGSLAVTGSALADENSKSLTICADPGNMPR